MQDVTLHGLASAGNAAREVDLLELGPDIAGWWDGAWLDIDGDLSAAPGWWWAW